MALLIVIVFVIIAVMGRELARVRNEVQGLRLMVERLELRLPASDSRSATPGGVSADVTRTALDTESMPDVTARAMAAGRPTRLAGPVEPSLGRGPEAGPEGDTVSQRDIEPGAAIAAESGAATESETPPDSDVTAEPAITAEPHIGTRRRAPGQLQFGEAPDERPAAAVGVDFETRIGTTWLLRIGLGVLAIALALFARNVAPSLPVGAKVLLAYAGAAALFGVGKYFEQRLERFAQPVMAAGLSFGFFVAFAAHFVPAMSAVSLPVSIAWMAFSMVTVLVAAERWASEATAALAILLGHVSAYVAAGAADLYSLVLIGLLAVTAILLLLRHQWIVLGVASVAVSYGSFFLWTLVDREPVAQDSAFWVSLAFLTSYYVVFLIADVLWWRRGGGDSGSLTRVQSSSARQLGPTNLVLYVTLTSFLYVTTGVETWAVEWYFLTLGLFQGVLAWVYRRLGHRDHVFYPAFGTALWTIGLFAAFDALVLNLVLAFQAVILLLAAHRTRMWIFHGLAQFALLVAFIHWLAYPPPATSSLPILVGGLGLVCVYFLKSRLEEVWYGEGSPGDWFDPSDFGVGRGIASAFKERFSRVAPSIAPFHAALGGLVLVREALRHFGAGTPFVLVLAAALLLLVASVLVRRRVALLFGVSAIAVAQLFASLSETLDGVLLAAALIGSASVLVLVGGRRLDGPSAQKAAWHAQIAAISALAAAYVALLVRDVPASDYVIWMLVPALLFFFQDRFQRATRGLATGSAEARGGADPGVVGLLAVGATALFVVALTKETLGLTVAAPVWIAGWSAALLAISLVVRSRALLVGACVLLWAGYWYFLSPEQEVVEDVLALWWAGAAVTVVALGFALTLDRVSAHFDAAAPREKIPALAWATYAGYALAFILIGTLADRQFAFGWSLLVPGVLAVLLLALSERHRLARAAHACVAGLVVLHLMVLLVHAQVGPMDEALLALVLLALATLVGERVIPQRVWPPAREQLLAYVRLALVALAAATTMTAIHASELFGALWATAGWSVLAAVLMIGGFAMKSAGHRRVALVVLGSCLLRVFLVDIRGLSGAAQTAAFFVLGLCLVGAAWLYSRFTKELRSWL